MVEIQLDQLPRCGNSPMIRSKWVGRWGGGRAGGWVSELADKWISDLAVRILPLMCAGIRLHGGEGLVHVLLVFKVPA